MKWDPLIFAEKSLPFYGLPLKFISDSFASQRIRILDFKDRDLPDCLI
jgi:hypothetical protein